MNIIKRFVLSLALIACIYMAPSMKIYANATRGQTTLEIEKQINYIQEESEASIINNQEESTDTTTESLEEPTVECPEEANAEIEKEDATLSPAKIVSIETLTQGTKTSTGTSESASDTTESTSDNSDTTTKTTKSSTKKAVTVPKMYQNLSKYRAKKLLELMKSSPKNSSYTGKKLKITGKNRALLEALVYGEAGGEGFIGQCLVAQAIRDTMVEENETSVKKIIADYQYAGKTNKGTSQSVKDAVSFIFDDGGYVVKHRIVFFYAPKLSRSRFHESQKFVLEWRGHRFFDNTVWIERDM